MTTKKHIDGAIKSLEKAIESIKKEALVTPIPDAAKQIRQLQKLITETRNVYILYRIAAGVPYALIGDEFNLTAPRISQIYTAAQRAAA